VQVQRARRGQIGRRRAQARRIATDAQLRSPAHRGAQPGNFSGGARGAQGHRAASGAKAGNVPSVLAGGASPPSALNPAESPAPSPQQRSARARAKAMADAAGPAYAALGAVSPDMLRAPGLLRSWGRNPPQPGTASPSASPSASTEVASPASARDESPVQSSPRRLSRSTSFASAAAAAFKSVRACRPACL
jgi:hypothetical protein